MESFLAGQTEGKSPRSLVSKLVPNPNQYPTPAYRVLKRNGIALKVDISDYIGHYLYFGFEDDATRELFSLCRRDSMVLDIGANIGWTALNLARIASTGKVIGFEPDPQNFAICADNVALNNLENLAIYPVGLGNESGKVNMEVRTPSNRGGNRVAPHAVAMGHGIEVVRLDDFVPVHDLPQIDLIKIDVEGYELNVLRGAEKLLRKHKPVLFIELDDNNLRDQGDSALALVSFLTDLGYREIVHAANKSIVSAESSFNNCHFDIIVR